ncbi:hypothetical protein BSPWISOXPB_3649, partial [uncultured Gammaproteobacteria bacterium]
NNEIIDLGAYFYSVHNKDGKTLAVRREFRGSKEL